MPSPKGQISKLVELLEATPMLSGYVDLRVLKSARNRTFDGSPPRIVIWAISGKIKNPGTKDSANRDVDRAFMAQIWGDNYDQVEELEALFVQALAYQAAGGPSSQSGLTPGQFWQAFDEEWDDHSDSQKRGEVAYMTFVARHSLNKPPQTKGEVDQSTLQPRMPALTAPMGTGDVAALVDSTEGFASNGLLLVEAEQIHYTTKTPTSFTGLIRGVNFTVPATHAQGIAIKVL